MYALMSGLPFVSRSWLFAGPHDSRFARDGGSVSAMGLASPHEPPESMMPGLALRTQSGPAVDTGLAPGKVAGQRAVHHGRSTFPCAIRFALHGVDIALLDRVRLPHQLAVGGRVLLGQRLPLVPPMGERLEGRPERGQL